MARYRYFHILNGLRGLYMPDSAVVIKVASRRELRAYLADEARHIEGVGLNKRHISWGANHAWRKGSKGAILPYAEAPRRPKAFALDISPASRAEYVEYQTSEGGTP